METDRSLQRILLVDDDPDERLLAIRELSHEFPHTRIQAVLGWTAIYQAFVDNNFDLVITDYKLRWATGLDVLRAVKAHDPNCPVVMFTGSGTQVIAVEAMKAGLDDYVLKSPEHRIRLGQAVRSVWQNAQMHRQTLNRELRLHFMLNALKVGVFRSTVDGWLMEASDGLLQLLKVSSLAEAQTFFQERVALAWANDAAPKQRCREVKLNSSANQPCWLHIREMRVSLGHQSFIDGLVSDISLQKQVSEVLQSRNQTLEQRALQRAAWLERLNDELGVFAFSISHDLRSPIRQVNGFVTLLEQELQSFNTNATVSHYLQQINQLTDRSGNMIDALLQFSRTGRAAVQYTPVSMDRLLQEIRRQMAPQLAKRTIRWQVEPLPAVWGDRNLLQQVWQNLIENAVKYTSLEPEAEIAIGSITGEDQTTFFIRDNGIGFNPEDATHLFGIFQRLPNASAFGGTGIGLANVQRVIHRHGGRLWAEGRQGVGAAFYFTLPSRTPKTRS
ncbi:MAG: ATP-binding protein [Leptolyngbyaceae cyanobacterium]